MSGLAPLLGAIALVLLGGLFAAIDAAISTVSVARVEEMMRDERPGAVRLGGVMAERPRYINLIVLLRIVCEVTATVLLVAYLDGRLGGAWGLTAALVGTLAANFFYLTMTFYYFYFLAALCLAVPVVFSRRPAFRG